MACPTCGSHDLRKTRNINESACDLCGCEFKESDNGLQVFVCGDFEQFMENVTRQICDKITDPMIRSAITHSVKGFLNEGYQALPAYIEHLTEEADSLYNQFRVGMREKEDFGAVVEGIGTLIEWVKLHEEDYPDFDDADEEELDVDVNDPDLYDDPDVIGRDEEDPALMSVGADDLGGLDMDEMCGEPEMVDPAADRPIPGQGLQVVGIGDMPTIGGLDTPPVGGLPPSDDVALDRAQSAADELSDALADLEDEVSAPPVGQTMGFYESENFAFGVGDKVYIGNDQKNTYEIIAIHEGKVVAKDNAGYTTTVDLSDDFRETDIQFSREEESAIVMERAEASAKAMKAKWEAFEKSLYEGEHVDDGTGKGDYTGYNGKVGVGKGTDHVKEFQSDEGHEEAEDKSHDKDGEVTSSVEEADDESDSPDFAGNDLDKRHGDTWGTKELNEKQDRTPEERQIIDKAIQDIHTDKLQVQDVLPQVPKHLRDDVMDELRRRGDSAYPERGPDGRGAGWKAVDESGEYDDEGHDLPGEIEDPEDHEEMDESVIGDHFHTPDGTKMPFPFTQDPTNSASEEYKDMKMEEDEEENEDQEEKAGLKAKDKIEESALKGLRVGDVIHKGSDFKTQWEVTRISRRPAKVHLKSGTKTTVLDPVREGFQYMEGVALGYERTLEGVDDSRKVWEALEESFKSEKSLQPINENIEVEEEEDVAEDKDVITKEELYHFVKEGDYHRMHRTAALQELVGKFGNPIAEMESVLDDAILSENDETIDNTYGVQELGELDTIFALKNAYAQMEEEIGLAQSAEDQKNGEMGGNPRKSSAEDDVMRDIGAGDDLRLNFNESHNRGFNL